MTKQRPVPMVERMSLWQRVVHGILILAILMLVVSGLALVYHQHGWAQALIAAMGGLGGRAAVHKAGAVLLVLVGLSHLLSLMVSPRYRRDMRESVPRLSDLRQGWSGVLWRTTGKGQPPRYGRFTPMQKFQYWGLLACCLVMGASGAVLWSPQASVGLFSKRFVDLMLVVHSSQAQVIFILFILWHLYDIHLAGGNFPMNPAWLTGKMREDLFKAQHGAEWDAMQKGTKE